MMFQILWNFFQQVEIRVVAGADMLMWVKAPTT